MTVKHNENGNHMTKPSYGSKSKVAWRCGLYVAQNTEECCKRHQMVRDQ